MEDTFIFKGFPVGWSSVQERMACEGYFTIGKSYIPVDVDNTYKPDAIFIDDEGGNRRAELSLFTKAVT